MRLKSVHLREFKRFTDTLITALPSTTRLIVLAGPNGSGKSSLFDGLKTWHVANGLGGYNWDEAYGAKVGGPTMGWSEHVSVEFHEALPEGPDEKKKMVYVRSAFRNEADFAISSFNRMTSPLDSPRISRLIDADASVSENYQRLIMATLDGVYSEELPESMTRVELRDRIIGRVRTAMLRVFPDLILTGVGGMTTGGGSVGTFYFTKGTSANFLYKNLSAGEKAAFDLILDAVVKSEYFNNTVWCIDEPETHLNTRIQGDLLEALVELLPPDCQMVLASHSIGFMSAAWRRARTTPGEVAFVDMQGVDFDTPVVLIPAMVSREFWSRTLDVALGDLASLVAPEHVVLCEGRPTKGNDDRRGEFDAACYRRIFSSQFPQVDFLSVGNSSDVQDNRLEAGRAIQTVASGTRTTRVIDRDLMNPTEVAETEAKGTRVLSRRNIEAFLLDDEVLAALCTAQEQPGRVAEALQIKQSALAASVQRGNDSDDLKKAASQIYNDLRTLLTLTQAGSDWNAFARGTLAGLLQPGMKPYEDLKSDIFEQ